jgi:hypothetical protein
MLRCCAVQGRVPQGCGRARAEPLPQGGQLRGGGLAAGEADTLLLLLLLLLCISS